MSQSIIEQFASKYKKPQVVDVRSGDNVRVHQKIREGNKERIQIFQGLVIRVDRSNSHTSRITVRKMASGVGVEKSFLVHSPLVIKIEVTKRSKVRRNYLSYMRELTGKATRLSGVNFDREAVNTIPEEAVALAVPEGEETKDPDEKVAEDVDSKEQTSPEQDAAEELDSKEEEPKQSTEDKEL